MQNISRHTPLDIISSLTTSTTISHILFLHDALIQAGRFCAELLCWDACRTNSRSLTASRRFGLCTATNLLLKLHTANRLCFQERHQALAYNETTEIYTFSNIRYAQPPTGALRFRAPAAPLVDRSIIRNGAEQRTCPQGIPAWQSKAFAPIDEFTAASGSFNLTAWEKAIEDAPPLPVDTTRGTTEDCLFLDVHVPKKIFERAQRHPEGGFHGVPVLVWVHGGGFVLGSKTGYPQPTYSPDLIMQKGQEYSKDGFIFVSLNYRLGALGFLSGPAVLQDGDQNAGLLDQRFAFEWVQNNIHLFGGAPDRVTAMGESGGGGSILALMVGAGVKAPFSQVIAQSPAMNPTLAAPAGAFDEFLVRLNVSCLADARKLDSSVIIRANSEQIGAAPPTSYVFGMVKDAKSMPQHLDVLFRRGDFDKTVKVFSAVNTLEGGFFFDPTAKTEDAVRNVIRKSMPNVTESQLDVLSNEIYPSVFDGSQGYTDQGSRQMSIYGDSYFYCNFLAANEASNGAAHACKLLPSSQLDILSSIRLTQLKNHRRIRCHARRAHARSRVYF